MTTAKLRGSLKRTRCDLLVAGKPLRCDYVLNNFVLLLLQTQPKKPGEKYHHEVSSKNAARSHVGDYFEIFTTFRFYFCA